jgi:hypothetical protein
MKLGKTFPDKKFQSEFAGHLSRAFKMTPWMISVDAADQSSAPFAGNDELLKIPFGVFDDSFLCQQHKRTNEPNWNIMRRDRWTIAPAGGEFSYYTSNDQRNALAPNGPHGIPFERAASGFHITFMIGDGQPGYRSMDVIRTAGLACGYKFRVLSFEANAAQSRVTITNIGVAPIYQHAFVTVNGVRAGRSLKGLLPGKLDTFIIDSGGQAPRLTLQCDRLAPGQEIEFEAALK